MSCGSAVVCAGSAPTGCISRCRSCRAERNLQMEVDTKEAAYQISGGDPHRSASRCSYATNSNAILSGPQRERRYEKMWPDLSYSQHNNMLRGLCQLLQWALLRDCGWRDWTKILSQTNGSLWRCKAPSPARETLSNLAKLCLRSVRSQEKNAMFLLRLSASLVKYNP